MTLISLKKHTLNWRVSRYWGIISLFLVSCDTPKEIGADLFSVEVGLNFTDTLSIKSSTVLFDSIYTGPNNNTLLLGSYAHPQLGTIESSFFAQVANADTLTSKATSIMDSLVMRMVYKGFQGDLSQSQQLAVYKLKDSLSFSKDYFTSSSLAFDPNPVGTTTLIPRPIKSKASNGDSLQYDTLSFRMNASFGKELLAKYTSKSISGGGPGFRLELPGLHIKSLTSNKSALLGFSPAFSRMTLYWHNPNDTTKYQLSYYFSLSNAFSAEVQARFNQFKLTKGAAFSSLVKSGDAIPASQTNNTTYVQSGTGFVTKLDIPNLLKLKGNRNIAINKAELIIQASDNIDLNETLGQLTLLPSDGNNRPLRGSFGLGYIVSEGGSGIQTSNYNATTNSFTYNITSELQAIVTGRKKNLGYLVTPAVTASSNGFVKLVSESGRFIPLNALKTKLRIYYSYIAQ